MRAHDITKEKMIRSGYNRLPFKRTMINSGFEPEMEDPHSKHNGHIVWKKDGSVVYRMETHQMNHVISKIGFMTTTVKEFGKERPFDYFNKDQLRQLWEIMEEFKVLHQ